MIAFLIEVVKALVTFFAVCVGLGILYLVFVEVCVVGFVVFCLFCVLYEQVVFVVC